MASYIPSVKEILRAHGCYFEWPGKGGEAVVVQAGIVGASIRPCAEHRKQMVPGDILVIDFVPLRKHVFRKPDCVSYVRFDQPPAAIVVGSLTIFLELRESCNDVSQRLFRWRWILFVFRRKSGTHLTVPEHSPRIEPADLEIPNAPQNLR